MEDFAAMFASFGIFLCVVGGEFKCTQRNDPLYRQEKNPFVKILLTQNEYRLESNILLLRQKINFFVLNE